MMDEAFALLDHLAARVTASAATGLACGAAFATLRGLPVFKTSTSAAASCAMISTACFGMERVVYYGVMRPCAPLLLSDDDVDGDDDDDGGKDAIIPPLSKSEKNNDDDNNNKLPSSLLYGSHAMGGMFGGGVVGFLFGGKTLAGAFLMMPIMLGAGKLELSLEEYRTERLKQLVRESDDRYNNVEDGAKRRNN